MTKLIGIIKITKSMGEVVCEQRMHSFVQNFAYMLNGLCNKSLPNNGVGTPMKDTSNASCSAGAYINSTTYFNWFNAAATAAGIDAYGMVIGTDDTAVALTDYILAAQIAHGISTGQMQYSAMSYQVGKISSGSNRAYKLIRYFINSSGAPITVKEVGFIARPYDITFGSRNVLICRDVLGVPVVVNDGELICVEMLFQITA